MKKFIEVCKESWRLDKGYCILFVLWFVMGIIRLADLDYNGTLIAILFMHNCLNEIKFQSFYEYIENENNLKK